MSEINAEDFVPTRSSQLRQNSVDDFQVVVHVKHQLKTSDKDISIDENKTLTFSEADMKKARFEVYKFSKSYLDFAGKQKSKVELAIQLGAIPPKNKGRNYKEILAERKLEKERVDKEKAEQSLAKQRYNMMKSSNNVGEIMKRNANSKKHRNGILGIYGKTKLKRKEKNVAEKKRKR